MKPRISHNNLLPQVKRMMRHHRVIVLLFYRCDQIVENLMKRLKKRSVVVGVFPSRSSCDRLLGAQLLEAHEKWALQQTAYFNMDSVDLAAAVRLRAIA